MLGLLPMPRNKSHLNGTASKKTATILLLVSAASRVAGGSAFEKVAHSTDDGWSPRMPVVVEGPSSTHGQQLIHCAPSNCGYCASCPSCEGSCGTCCPPRPSLPATPASAPTYTPAVHLVTSGTCNGAEITSLADCSAAAVALGLSDTTASDDGQSGVSNDPPYCYFEGGSLRYNSNGGNTGSCNTDDQCLCYPSPTAPTPAPPPATPATPAPPHSPNISNSTSRPSSPMRTPRRALSHGPGHSFADRAALLVARDAWCADPTAAAATYGPIEQWDVSNVDDLSYMFCAYALYAAGGGGGDRGCNTACSTFNSNISAWDTSSVTSMQARALTSAPRSLGTVLRVARCPPR
jgi:surface protein